MPTKKRLKKIVRKSTGVVASKRPLRQKESSGKGFRVVWKNLVLFIVLLFLSILLGLIFTDPMLDQLFWILAILTGFVAVALFIVWFAMILARAIKK